MPNARSLLNRVARLEEARVPKRSRIARAFGSFDAFEEQVRQEVEAGALDRIDMLGETGDGGVLRCLRQWEEDGLI
ncbi:hypothetical protein [Celeribacter baekdonensis]|uniref:Uncharacterized protein n=1 Tax=Celeribacter baekdonensis TaxID=875171 RepID=A0A2R4M0J1_9RHOB|nr:hypothetical protein [Celeribacter baekdonensis]AVW90638.1 hypothetical protein DA792_05655 [Celeribacter baekdonensis]